MKCMGLLMLCFLVGCTPLPSLEELEAQAYVTGDWSKVDRRERTIARREVRSGLSCPRDLVSMCESHLGFQRCACVSRDAMKDVLSSFRR